MPHTHINILTYSGDNTLTGMLAALTAHKNKYGRIPREIWVEEPTYKWYEGNFTVDNQRKNLRFHGILVRLV